MAPVEMSKLQAQPKSEIEQLREQLSRARESEAAALAEAARQRARADKLAAALVHFANVARRYDDIIYPDDKGSQLVAVELRLYRIARTALES